MSGFSREDTINDTAFVNISGPNIHISSSFPDLLCQNVYLTPEQDKSIGYTSIDSRPRTLCSDEARDLLYRYFPEGILSNLDVDIREELLLKGYASENEQFSTDTYLDRNDAKIIPGVDLMVKRITRVATTIIESCFDENAKQRFHNRAIAKASLCVGDDRNKYTSTIRIHLIDPNSSPTLIRVLEDDPALYTVRIHLGIAQDGQFPGRICLPTFQEYCNMEPFTALVFKRTMPFFEIQQSTPTSDHISSRNTASPRIGRGIVIEISPNQRLMNNSHSLGYPRSMPRPITVFGTFKNYSEWLFRLAIIESIGRESRGAFIPADINLDSIAKLYGYQIDTTTFLPRLSLANTILQYPDHDLEDWNSFVNRIMVRNHKSLLVTILNFMQELHNKTGYPPHHLETHPSLKIISQPISWIPQTPPSNTSRRTHSNVISSTADQSTRLQNTANPTSAQTRPTNRNTNPISLSNQSITLGEVTRHHCRPSGSTPEIEVGLSQSSVRRSKHGHEAGRNQASPLFQPTSTNMASGDNTITLSQNSPARGTTQGIVQESQTSTTVLSGDEINATHSTSKDIINDPSPIPLVPHPYDGYNCQPPEWDPLNGLTAVMNKQILNLFDLEKLREATRATYHDPIQPITKISDLQGQLNLHIQALEQNHSTFNDYFHLVYSQIVKSDERQRLRFGLATKSMEADIFWKDFFDRNALVCQMSLHIGTPILLAPGFYALVLTAGGNSPGSNSLVRSPLQPAMRNRIVEACLWYSRSHSIYMDELKSFWESSFAQFDSYSNDSKIIKLSQNIPSIIPSIGSCFPKHFTVLHQIITHTVNSLQSENKGEDIIWDRPYETDRLGCIREAGDSLRSLSKAKLNKRICKSSEASIVFKNILSIRTLFFGNLKKLQRWKKFTSLEEVEDLVISSSPFEEWYGQSRVSNQFQFPLTYQEFSTRLKSCWRVNSTHWKNCSIQLVRQFSYCDNEITVKE
ncbi:hypothetical protein ABEW05_005479 [Botrytis cinerea]